MTIRLVAAIGTLMVMAVVMVVLARKMRHKDVAVSRRAVNLLFPVSQVCVLSFLFYYLFVHSLPLWLFGLTAFVGVSCGLGDIILFKALLTAEEKELAEERVRLLEEQLAMQEAYCDRLAPDIHEAQSMQADMVEALEAADALLRRNEFEEASRQLRHIANIVDRSGRYCEHCVVDALVATKADAGKKLGIPVSFDLLVPDEVALPSVDLCAVFSNLLDNALQACGEVPLPERMLEMKARIVRGYLVVDLINSCTKESLVHADRRRSPRRGLGLTEHGWGLVIVEGIAARHEGTVKTEQVGLTFHTTVMLKLAAPKF